MYTLVGNTAIISKDVTVLNRDLACELADKKINHIKFECGSKLEKVEKSAFETVWMIESIDFSNCQNLKRIEEYAFQDCVCLKNVDFSNCTNLQEICQSAFTYCPELVEVKFNNCDSLTKIDNMAFRECAKLKTFQFEGCKNLQVIGEACFEHCSALDNVNLSESKNLIIIEPYAFGHCSSLKNLSFPKNTEKFNTIGRNAFVCCESLEKVDLSNTGIYSIGVHTFTYCDKLRDLNLSNCKNLRQCYNIKNSDLLGNLPQLDNLDLRGCPNLEKFKQISTKNLHIGFISRHTDNIRGLFKYSVNNDADIFVYDRKGKAVIKFKNDGKSFSKLNPYAIGLFYYAKQKGSGSVSVNLLNALTSNQEMDVALNNYDEVISFAELRAKEIKPKHFSYSYFLLLRELGYFGMNCDKGELESYRNLLAKDFIKHKIKNDLKTEQNRNYINKLIQQKMNKVAKNYPLSKLVLEFVKNNLVNHKNEKILLDIVGSSFNQEQTPKIKFAQFFVNNFDSVMNKNVYQLDGNIEFQQAVDGYLPINMLFNNFDEILNKSNKMVITRSDYQRFTVEDCKALCSYENIKEGSEKLATLCASANISQEGFNYLQDLFEKGKSVKDKQVLETCSDDENNEFSYKFIEKDNPIGLVLGNITNCCQRYGSRGQSCMEDGATNVNSGFLTINYNKRIIGQAWVWYNPETYTVALDNIEVPDVNMNLVNKEHSTEINNCIERACQNIFKTMNKNGHRVDNIYIGVANTDIEKLEDKYKITKKQIECPYANYNDINSEGQYVVVENGKFQEKLEVEKQKGAEDVQNY